MLILRSITVWGPAMMVCVLSLAGVLLLLSAPPRSGPVALVFPPWWSGRQVAEAAALSGRLIRLGGAGFVAVVLRDAPGARAPARSRAWLTLNPRVAGFCTGRDVPRQVRP